MSDIKKALRGFEEPYKGLLIQAYKNADEEVIEKIRKLKNNKDCSEELIIALEHKFPDKLIMLLIDITSELGLSLNVALKNCKNKEILKAIINKETDFHKESYDRVIPLGSALVSQDIEIVNILIEKTDRLNEGRIAFVALLNSFVRGETELIKFFLDKLENVSEGKKFDINCISSNNYTPLMMSIKHRCSPEITKYLIEKTNNIDQVGYVNKTALTLAYEYKLDEELISMLINKSYKPLALIKLLQNWQCDDALKLIEHMDDVDERINYKTALTIALGSKNEELINKLIQKTKNFDITNYNGENALCVAIRNKRDDELIKFLIEKTTDFNQMNEDGEDVLYLAMRNKMSPEIIKLLIEKTKSVDHIYQYSGFNVLLVAIHYKVDVENTITIINKTKDIDFLDSWGYNALYYAVKNESDDRIIKVLIDKTDNVDISDSDRTLLNMAINYGISEENIIALVKKTKNVNITIGRCDPPLVCAIYHRLSAQTIKLLIEKSDIYNYRAAFIEAIKRNHLVDLFLENNNIPEISNGAALYNAIAAGHHQELIKKLIHEVTYFGAFGRNKETVLDIAIDNKYDKDIINLIAEKMMEENKSNAYSKMRVYIRCRDIFTKYIKDFDNVDMLIKLMKCDLGSRAISNTLLKYYQYPKDTVNVLLQNIFDENNPKMNTLLVEAIANRADPEVIRILINKLDDIDYINENGNNALLESTLVSLIDYDISMLLIKKTKNVDVLNKNGENALSLSIGTYRSELIRLLLDKTKNHSKYFLMRAMDSNLDVDIAKDIIKLTEEHIDVTHSDYKTNALHNAIYTQDDEIIKILIEKTKDVDQKDYEGKTVIDKALKAKINHDLIRMLLCKTKNINRYVKNKKYKNIINDILNFRINKECFICLLDFEENDSFHKMKCGHIIHNECNIGKFKCAYH